MSDVKISRLNTADADFFPTLNQLIAWEMVSNADVEAKVAEILQQVRNRGDEALIEYSNQFDRRNCQSMEQIALPHERLQEALNAIEPATKTALQRPRIVFVVITAIRCRSLGSIKRPMALGWVSR